MPGPTFVAVTTNGCHDNVVHARPRSTLFLRPSRGGPATAVLRVKESTWSQPGLTYFLRHAPNRQYLSKVQLDLSFSLYTSSTMVPLTLSSCFVPADRASGRL
jgi:hypothetical protein